MTEFGLNDTGGILILTLIEDGVAKSITTASAISYLIKDPNQIVVTKTAGFNTDGSDGKVKYTFVAGDLDIVGLYEVQVNVITPTWTGTSSSYKFKVRKTLEVTI